MCPPGGEWAYHQFLRQHVGDERREAGEDWREKDADVADVNGDVEEVEGVVEDGGRHHQACNNTRGLHKGWGEG